MLDGSITTNAIWALPLLAWEQFSVITATSICSYDCRDRIYDTLVCWNIILTHKYPLLHVITYLIKRCTKQKLRNESINRGYPRLY